MNSQPAIAICPRCGASLADGSVDGLCARCLGALPFELETSIDGTGGIPPAPPPEPEELVPFFPQLEVHSLLGRGGMGVVYKARQKSLNRWVALKLLAPERAADPSFADRFAREARALAALNHPHIVAIHDFGQAGGFFYLLMEYVDGVNLRQLLKSRRLTPDEALRIIPPICDALQCAHDLGIVHRDIKPENLLIDRAGTVKIADFGIARMLGEAAAVDLTRNAAAPHPVSPTVAVGTPGYAAPEQRACAATDPRADIYSLGVVLYEMLTGEIPGAKDVIAPSRRVQVDVRIDEIVLKALAGNPDRRYNTVEDFRMRVQQAEAMLAHTRTGRGTNRLRRAAVATVAVASAAAMTATALWWHPWLPSASHAPATATSKLVPPPPTSPADPDNLFRELEDNFSNLIDLRQEAMRQTIEKGSPAPDLTRKIAALEAHDRELRKRIGMTD